MSSKKRRHQEHARLRAERERHKKRDRTIVGVFVAAGLIFGLVYWGVSNAPPYDWTQCFTGRGVDKHFAIYIQVGERHGELNVSFLKIPINFGESPGGGCAWPFHTHDDRPGSRSFYYTLIHSHPPNTHQNTLADFFDVWGSWLYSTNSSLPNRPIYFASNGVAAYRTNNFEMLIHRGPLVDPANRNYTSTVRSNAYGAYVPQDGDYIELLVHEPYQTLGSAYVG